MTRPKATSQRLQETERVIITEWRLAAGAETGWHRHAHDYIVVCLTAGQLTVSVVIDRLGVLGEILGRMKR